jgi:hypothetical protein
MKGTGDPNGSALMKGTGDPNGSALMKGTGDPNGSALMKGTGDPNGSALMKGTGDPKGSLPKKRARNPNLRSASYARQSPFEGSDRQVRGAILRLLLGNGEIAEAGLTDLVAVGPERLERILWGLERDGFIGRAVGRIQLQDRREGSR